MYVYLQQLQEIPFDTALSCYGKIPGEDNKEITFAASEIEYFPTI